ncbi:hypothetical protein BJ742DRAFT_765609 [Cladochytrium replicatum]|nr:hypothetical protein BJ742DRAFT_765609 [Cladochytrium replicatum]
MTTPIPPHACEPLHVRTSLGSPPFRFMFLTVVLKKSQISIKSVNTHENYTMVFHDSDTSENVLYTIAREEHLEKIKAEVASAAERSEGTQQQRLSFDDCE